METKQIEKQENMVLTFKTDLYQNFVSKLKAANNKLEKYNYQIKILKKESFEKNIRHGITEKWISVTLDTPLFVEKKKYEIFRFIF